MRKAGFIFSRSPTLAVVTTSLMLLALMQSSCSGNDNNGDILPNLPGDNLPNLPDDNLRCNRPVGAEGNNGGIIPNLPDDNLPNLPDGLPLAAGQSSGSKEVATLSSGQTHLISYNQQCSAPVDNKGCCVLVLHRNNIGIDVLTNPGSTFVSSLLDGLGDGPLSGFFFAESACQYSNLQSNAAPTASTMVQVSQMGQSVMHADMEMQLSQGRYFLRDVSRRASTGSTGCLADSSHISAEQFHDYQPRPSNIAGHLTHSLYSYAADTGPDSIFAPRAFDALAHSQMVHDFFFEDFSLSSWNNAGASMISVIETPFPRADFSFASCGQPERIIEKGSSFNAFYVRRTPRIFFTPLVKESPTASRISTTLSVSLDVVAHEWGHAFLDGFSQLRYERESGALNEAFADWTAVRISHKTGADDWLIGNEVRDVDNNQTAGFRDMSKFREVGDDDWRSVSEEGCPSPALCNDYCGVHRNNGIPNHMFYLLSAGGTVTPASSSSPIVIEGIGIDKAYQIAFMANRSFWTSTVNFVGARAGMEMAARMLFPTEPDIERQVGLAWAAVKVGRVPPASLATAPATPSQNQLLFDDITPTRSSR